MAVFVRGAEGPRVFCANAITGKNIEPQVVMKFLNRSCRMKAHSPAAVEELSRHRRLERRVYYDQ